MGRPPAPASMPRDAAAPRSRSLRRDGLRRVSAAFGFFGAVGRALGLALGLSLAGLAAAASAPAPSDAAIAHTTGGSSRQALDERTALATGRSVIGREVGAHRLLDRNGRAVTLTSYRGKPLLVSFIYTGCFQICPSGTKALDEAVKGLEKAFGPDSFRIVSIGFNQPFDSPSAMRAFAAQQGITAKNWDFLSPPPETVQALTRDFGFSYVATPAGFDHVLMATVVDAQGRIHAQVFGDRLTASQVGEPLRQLLRATGLPAEWSLASVVERVRVLCTVYDAQTGRYRYDYGLILEIAGGLTFLIAMGVFFAGEWRDRRRRARSQTQAPGAATLPAAPSVR